MCDNVYRLYFSKRVNSKRDRVCVRIIQKVRGGMCDKHF